MPGPHCKPKRFFRLGISWAVECSCSYTIGGFQTKAKAQEWAKRHKNDDELALPEPIRRAILLLSDFGLIQGDYDRLRTSTK